MLPIKSSLQMWLERANISFVAWLVSGSNRAILRHCFSNMKAAIKCLLVFGLFALCLASGQPEVEDPQVAETSARSRFQLPRLFDFAAFQSRFDKHYKSLVEQSERQRLFWARAIRAIRSAFSYKFGKQSSYLAINQMSDWTPEERSQLSNRQLEEDNSETGIHPREKRHANSLQESSIMNVEEEPRMGSMRFLFGGQSDSKSGGQSKPAGPTPLIYVAKEALWRLTGRKVEDESGLPDEVHVDHRRSGCFLPARYQGNCGCCYIFSTMALYEYLHCKQRGRLYSFSEQYPLDCGSTVLKSFAGCNGGRELVVANFVEAHGIEATFEYPYKAKASKCPFGAGVEHKSSAYNLVVHEPGLELVQLKDLEKTLEESPIIIAVKVNDKFYDYGGGVDENLDCRKGDGLHSMLIVGHGREDGKGYWLLRNSYSSSWGHFGYWKLDKRADCFARNRLGMISRATFELRH